MLRPTGSDIIAFIVVVMRLHSSRKLFLLRTAILRAVAYLDMSECELLRWRNVWFLLIDCFDTFESSEEHGMRAINEVFYLTVEYYVFINTEVSNKCCHRLFAKALLYSVLVGLVLISP